MKDDLRVYLNQLTKSEIINLIFEYVPADHLNSINNTRVNEGDALLVFEEVKNRLFSWFDDIDFIREPYDMESGLSNQLHILRGLELQIIPHLSEFIILFIEKIKSSIYEGYLDDYREDYSFQFPEEFIDLIKIVICNLPPEQKISFQQRIENIIETSTNATFYALKNCF